MFTLTRREKAIVLYVLATVVIGMGVKRCREWHRESAAPGSAVEGGSWRQGEMGRRIRAESRDGK